MKTVVILAAAGRGERLGGEKPKIWAEVCGRPLIYHAISCVERSGAIDGTIVMAPPGDVETVRKKVSEWGFGRVINVIGGGERRQDTVQAGLAALPQGCEIAVIHDAARPLASTKLFERVIEAARRSGAAAPAIEPVDTVVQCDETGSIKYLDRKSLRLIQTPQAFRVDIIRQAHRRAAEEGFSGTDDAGLVVRIGLNVELVEGEKENFKITHQRDLLEFEALLP